jgi:hypothetical protein
MRPIRLVGRTRLRDGSRLISPHEAMEMAERGVEVHLRRDEKCTLTPAVEGARPASVDLVQRLDRPDEYYYLVTLHRRGRPTAVLRGDALFGTFQGALALGGEARSTIISSEAALEAARRAPIDLPDGRGRLRIRDGAYGVYPHLVWRPCMESRSPYYPFRQISIGAQTIYVDYEGRVYPALHDLGRG